MAPGSCRGGFGEFWRVLKAGKPALGLRDLLELQERSAARPEWRLGAAGEGLGSFEGWQTAALNVHKKTLPRPQGLPRPEWRLGAAGEGLGS